MDDLKNLDEQISDLITTVGYQTRLKLSEPLKIEQKTSRRDLVTNVDKNNEQLIISALKQIDPNAQILGEEGFGNQISNTTGRIFVVDPIDGTMNFVMQSTNFAIMIAVYEDGVGKLGYILDVMNQKLYHGGPQFGVYINDQRITSPENKPLADTLIAISGPLLMDNVSNLQQVAKTSRGVRMYGSAGIEISAVINGQLGGYISYLKPWDFGAGKILAQALGLTVKGIDGKPLDMLSSTVVLVATERASQEIIKLAN